MSRGFARRQVALAALALNAVRPLPGRWAGIPAFALGWPVSELAPHLLSATLLDTAAELSVRRRSSAPSTTGLVAAAASAGLLAYSIAAARRVGTELDDALRESIGENYLTDLDLPGPVDLTIPRGAIARPFRFRQHDVEVIRHVPYTEGGRRAQLDIYRPRDVDLSGAPVLIQIHGGGWTIGTKEQQGLLLMNRMAQRGWICVAMNYRLAPKHPFPAQIIDVKKTIAWTRENIAAYGGDPSYLVVTGGSAGGHLSALAALTPGEPEYQPDFESADTSVAGCVPFYGVYDLAGLNGEKHAVAMRDYFLGPRVFKKNPATHLDDFIKASPLTHVSPDAPDFFVLHGALDSLVDVRQARTFVEKLKTESKATVTYAEFPATQHAFEVFGSIRSHHVIKAVERWLLHHRTAFLSRQAERDSAAG